jgi:ABC-type long-subunit fatty acid transport system fused permease/ATPase subunit
MNLLITLLKPVLVLLALICWWRHRSRFAPRSGWLGLQLAVALVDESYASMLNVRVLPNLWWYDLYVPVEFGLLLGYTHGHLKQRWQRAAVWPAAVLLAVAYAIDLHSTYPTGFVSRAYILGSLVITAALLALLYDLALRTDRALHAQPLFWAFLGMVLFFAGMVPLLGLWNQLTSESPRLAHELYTANHVLFLLRYGGVIVACAIKEPR